MFQSRKELFFRVLKKNGLRGLLNLYFRQLDAKNMPEKTRFFPTAIQIETTTRCNLACEMCEHTYLNKKGNDMSFEDFKKVIDSNPFLAVANLTGIGEALLNKEFFQMVEYAKKRGLYVWFNDNFTLMNESTAEKLIELGVDAVAISIDGATKKTYESIRKNAHFETVVKNVRKMSGLRKNSNRRLEMMFVMVVMKKNLAEMPALIKLAKELGVDNVLFVDLIDFKETEKEALENTEKENFKSVIKETEKTAKKLGVKIMGLPSLEKSPTKCCYPWTNCYVTFDGQVLPCCFVTQRNNPHVLEQAVMGNIKTDKLSDIWNNDKYLAIRKQLKAGRVPGFCQGCHLLKGA
jgi:radical SAM protein with 4Fe4S-binding SPASM domain